MNQNFTSGRRRLATSASNKVIARNPKSDATTLDGKTATWVLKVITLSLYACRAKAIRFSVEDNSSCRLNTFALALRSG